MYVNVQMYVNERYVDHSISKTFPNSFLTVLWSSLTMRFLDFPWRTTWHWLMRSSGTTFAGISGRPTITPDVPLPLAPPTVLTTLPPLCLVGARVVVAPVPPLPVADPAGWLLLRAAAPLPWLVVVVHLLKRLVSQYIQLSEIRAKTSLWYEF